MACGDLSAFDSDMTYSLSMSLSGKEYEQLPPTQMPINPPYKKACELKKTNKLPDEMNTEKFTTNNATSEEFKS